MKYYGLTPSDNAIFLACLYIAKRGLWGKGIGRQLFEKVASDLTSRGHNIVEAIACIGESPSSNIPDWYTGPLEFFVKMGFKIMKSIEHIALVRNELDRSSLRAPAL
jgi:hypothetical protein